MKKFTLALALLLLAPVGVSAQQKKTYGKKGASGVKRETVKVKRDGINIDDLREDYMPLEQALRAKGYKSLAAVVKSSNKRNAKADNYSLDEIKRILADDVETYYGLSEKYPTALQLKKFKETEAFATLSEELAAKREKLRGQIYYLRAERISNFNLEDQSFEIEFHYPTPLDPTPTDRLRDPFDGDAPFRDHKVLLFRTPQMAEDVALEVETKHPAAYVLLTFDAVEGGKMQARQQRVMIVDEQTKRLFLDYKSEDEVAEAAEQAATEEEEEDTNVYSIVETMPAYPGGDQALIKDIFQNLVYPEVALEQEIQGRVVLQFVVKKDGTVGNIRVKRSLSAECDAAAAEAVKKLKRFTPGTQNGKPVSVWFTLPITFSIQ